MQSFRVRSFLTLPNSRVGAAKDVFAAACCQNPGSRDNFCGKDLNRVKPNHDIYRIIHLCSRTRFARTILPIQAHATRATKLSKTHSPNSEEHT